MQQTQMSFSKSKSHHRCQAQQKRIVELESKGYFWFEEKKIQSFDFIMHHKTQSKNHQKEQQ